MNLSPQDLRTMMVPPRLPRAPRARRAAAPTAADSGRGRPAARRADPAAPPSRPGGPPPAPRKAQASVRRPPLPTLLDRPFASPWEELALTYESLPAPDAASQLRWLFRASEVWETGGKDIARAFDALARAFAQARRSPGGDAEVRARLQPGLAQDHGAWEPASPSSTRAWPSRPRPPPRPPTC